ncbi:NAD(P)-binding Rossmann-fold containing protein [Venustampulla echinocandica]|uniref:NAD(P)-binding Rossmann-fold containing protein n=1 Tax=Venustampulla echinocandica TaxID=2656787 RepID=A0A370TR39_9HELO|nr:NAD(P)-binding Rossmann-fold containing protein [Venustampulla echinocandica]RDL37981.1 NAD(P)-binding Rossmann-fold containing protein [Venustampulla echinocandica]
MLASLFTQSSVSFDPETDIPDLSGKVIAITGGNAGLGKETVLRLASHNPSHIYILARNLTSTQEAITGIQTLIGPSCAPITPIKCDLADLDSVKAAAKDLQSKTSRLDILFLNAGIMLVAPGLTAQGYEIQFGTNHMGHFLLAQLLLPVLRSTASSFPDADVRVVVLSSLGMYATIVGGYWGGGIDFDSLKQAGSSFVLANCFRYGQAKLANALFAKEMQKRYGGDGITCISVHPGVITTGLWKHFFGFAKNWGIGGSWISGWGKYIPVVGPRSVEEGAVNQLWAAVGKRNELPGGEFCVPVGVQGAGMPASSDIELAGRLWEWSAKEVAGYMP